MTCGSLTTVQLEHLTLRLRSMEPKPSRFRALKNAVTELRDCTRPGMTVPHHQQSMAIPTCLKTDGNWPIPKISRKTSKIRTLPRMSTTSSSIRTMAKHHPTPFPSRCHSMRLKKSPAHKALELEHLPHTRTATVSPLCRPIP